MALKFDGLVEPYTGREGTKECNNFRWLSTAKEAKILFFVPDINGEKFLPAHATREIFLSYLSPRLRGFPPFVVLSPAWSKLLFPWNIFGHSWSALFPFPRPSHHVIRTPTHHPRSKWSPS